MKKVGYPTSLPIFEMPYILSGLCLSSGWVCFPRQARDQASGEGFVIGDGVSSWEERTEHSSYRLVREVENAGESSPPWAPPPPLSVRLMSI